jgi:predicted phage terminase large subunit-like protein
LIAEKLEAVERGEIDRLMIFMPPRHGKSELASPQVPSALSRQASEPADHRGQLQLDLATDFGRDVRNLVASPEYAEVFPKVSLRVDSKAADRMNTNHGGVYIAAGVGTATTGRGAHLGIIDDPFKDSQDADSERQRDIVWNWYRSTFFTRLMPGGAIVLIQCMTGDTPVLMADGSERPLEDIRAGDLIATYEHGALATSTVRNWTNQGPDRVFTIKMKSGITVRANARHPFLVVEDGEEKWQRTDSLKPGSVILRAIGESGGASSVPQMGATSPLSARACAAPITTRAAGARAFARLRSTLARAGKRICATATELIWRITGACWPSKAVSAPSANSRPQRLTPARIGTGNSASIIATTANASADCCVTTATLRSGTERPRPFFALPLTTFGIERDEVIGIVDGGVEDVFDIQVDRTENFIANGLVSHNTRWHEDDLAGRLLDQDGRKEDGGEWDVLELPAIWDGKALWPEWYDLPALERIKRTIGPREWSALYMQSPQPDEGTFFQRDWLKSWETQPSELRIYGTSDYAVTDGRGDYTVHRIWGVSPTGGIYRLDGWRGQATADVWIERKLDLIAKHKPMAWFGEAGVIQKAVEPMLVRRMRERKVRCRLEWLSSIQDKPTRARGFQSRAAMGEVWFEPGADLSEFLTFPAGKHDDEVDVASLMGRALDMAHPAILKPEQAPAQKPRKDYRGQRDSSEGDGEWQAA